MASEGMKETLAPTTSEGAQNPQKSFDVAPTTSDGAQNPLHSFHNAMRQTNPLLEPEDDPKTLAKKKMAQHDVLNIVWQPVMVALVFFNMNFVTGNPATFWYAFNDTRFMMLFFATMAYFVVDTIWICLVPAICKSPGPIYAHHIVAMLYLSIPLLIPEMRWFLGACLIVEGNTWFLMIRRYHNPDKVVPFAEGVPLFTSMRIQLVIVLFHVTWVGIRVFWYPILMVICVLQYIEYSNKVGTWINGVMVAPIMHSLFVYLNLLWSYELYCVKKKGPVKEENMDL